MSNDMDLLIRKMNAEQDVFYDWLIRQSVQKVLDHAYEYAMREDILLYMEDCSLTDKQIDALLCSPCPLADIYKEYSKLDCPYSEVMIDTIEGTANMLLKRKQEEK